MTRITLAGTFRKITSEVSSSERPAFHTTSASHSRSIHYSGWGIISLLSKGYQCPECFYSSNWGTTIFNFVSNNVNSFYTNIFN